MKSISVDQFFELQKEEFNLKLLTVHDKSLLTTKQLSPFISRPGLPLTGFFEHYEPDRIQILGESEVLYLFSIKNNKEKIENIKTYFQYDIPLIIITKNKEVPSFFVELGNKYKVPIFRTSKGTDIFYKSLRLYLDTVFAKTTTRFGIFASVYGVGVLITGSKGMGKSEAVLELIQNKHQYICDERVLIYAQDGKLFGKAASDSETYPLHINGVGVIDVKQVFGVKSILKSKHIDLEVNFQEKDINYNYNRRELNLGNEKTNILKVKIPIAYIDISPGKNIALLIEMLAIQYLSKYVFNNKIGKKNDKEESNSNQ